MGRRTRPDDDPIERYREWANNSLNEGHWLGANIPPAVRNLWAPKDRRWLGALWVGVSAVAFGVAVYTTLDIDSLLLACTILIPFLVPGLIMLFAKDDPK